MSCVLYCASRKDQDAIAKTLKLYPNPKRSPHTGRMTTPKPRLFYQKDTPVDEDPRQCRHYQYNPTTKSVRVVAAKKKSHAISVPLAWAITHIGRDITTHNRPPLDTPMKNIPLLRPLYDPQKIVLEQVSSAMRIHRSCTLALHTGFGKCFAVDTMFLVAPSGGGGGAHTTKAVQDLCVGDILTGPASNSTPVVCEPKLIVSVCRGVDHMYSIAQQTGCTYTVNSCHILSLALPIVTVIAAAAVYFDIEIETYLTLPAYTRSLLRGYRISPDGKTAQFHRISVSPLADGHHAYYGFTVAGSPSGKARVLLADRTVVHNTTIACAMMPRAGYRTAVILPKSVLFSQWEETIRLCLGPGPRIQIVKTGKDPIDRTADIVLLSPAIACKKTLDDFSGIGTLITDEAHLLCGPAHCKLYFRFRPRILICLTATPEKSDGMEKVTFAAAGTCVIRRSMNIPHKVLALTTHYAPDPDQLCSETGSLDWNAVLEWQCNHPSRNRDVAQLATTLASEGRVVLVLCKRVVQVHDILSRIPAHIPSDSFTGTAKTFDRDTRILVSSYSKSGVGFDLPSLDTLVVASDVEAMIQQYHGRVFRRRNVNALVVDLCDDFESFRRHGRTRRKYYKEAGGVEVRTTLARVLRAKGMADPLFGMCVGYRCGAAPLWRGGSCSACYSRHVDEIPQGLPSRIRGLIAEYM